MIFLIRTREYICSAHMGKSLRKYTSTHLNRKYNVLLTKTLIKTNMLLNFLDLNWNKQSLKRTCN